MARRFKSIAAYYDAENQRHEMLRHDVTFFLSKLPKTKLDVLELAVGTGRAAIPIAQAGHRVVGVDFDPAVLRIARQKRDAAGLGEHQLSLVQSDAKTFASRRRFDFVCIFFNTFLNFVTLPEQDALLKVIRRHLKPDGRVWIDIFQPDLNLLSHEHTSGLEPGTFFVQSLNRTVYRQTELLVNPTTQVQHVTFHYQWYDSNHKRHHEKREFDLTFLFPREMRLLLERHGLAIQRTWGDYNGSALGVQSPRMIFLCRLMNRR